jgi:hypothetical protein
MAGTSPAMTIESTTAATPGASPEATIEATPEATIEATPGATIEATTEVRRCQPTDVQYLTDRGVSRARNRDGRDGAGCPVRWD